MSEIKAGDKIRVKTKEELGDRPAYWNKSGYMDYLFGTEQVVERVSGGRIYVKGTNARSCVGEWSLPYYDVELLPKKIHQHHDLIIAWLNGATVQFRITGSGKWNTPRNVTETGNILAFSNNYEYRLKPEKSEAQVELEKLQDKIKELQEQADTLEKSL